MACRKAPSLGCATRSHVLRDHVEHCHNSGVGVLLSKSRRTGRFYTGTLVGIYGMFRIVHLHDIGRSYGPLTVSVFDIPLKSN